MNHDVDAVEAAQADAGRAEWENRQTVSRNYAPAERRAAFADDPRKKSPWLAAMLSAMPGLGQVYVGYYRQGFVHILVIASLMALLSSQLLYRLEGPLGFVLAFVWLYNVVDAARRASLYNQALAGLRPMELPEDAKAPVRLGSSAGGAALIAIGLVLFGHTMFGMSLQWIERWWPLGLVGAGVWLVYEDWRARSLKSEG